MSKTAGQSNVILELSSASHLHLVAIFLLAPISHVGGLQDGFRGSVIARARARESLLAL